jgi:hypothetical protein
VTTARRYVPIHIAGLTLALQLWLPVDADAQGAWLPVKGETAVSTTFQQFELNGHFEDNGDKTEGSVPSRSSVAVVEVEHGLTDKLALTGRLFYVASKYTGFNEPPVVDLPELCTITPRCVDFVSLDTGSYYSTFQDVELLLRYSLLEKGLAVTPALGATIPTHDYRTVGEAGAGQNLFALHTGVSVGRLFDPWTTRAYFQVRYAYSFVQQVYDIPLNRSNAEFEVGYRVAPLVWIRGLARWQRTHGGLTWDEVYGGVYGPDGEVRPDVTTKDALLLLDHDRLLASRYWHVGGGATVALTDSLDLDSALLTFVSGADTHYGIGFSVGLTWRFVPDAPSRPPTRVPAPLPAK